MATKLRFVFQAILKVILTPFTELGGMKPFKDGTKIRGWVWACEVGDWDPRVHSFGDLRYLQHSDYIKITLL